MKLSDLFGPRWKHSNPAVRRGAVMELQSADFASLEYVAGNDPVASLRLVAIEKISDTTTLERLAVLDQPTEVLHAIRARLNVIFKAATLNSPDQTHAQPSLMRIDNDQVLADVACEAPNVDVRLSAIRLIHQPAVLCDVAERACGKEAGVALVAKLDDEASLERVAAKGSNKAIRRAASEKLAALRAESNQPTARDRREEELKELVAQAEQLADSWNWQYTSDRFDAALKRWAQLDPQGSHAGFMTLQRACLRFQKRKREFDERQATERVEAEAREAAMQQRRDLVTAAEALAEPPAEVIAEPVAEVSEIVPATDDASAPAVDVAAPAEAAPVAPAIDPSAELDRLAAAWDAVPESRAEEAVTLAERFHAAIKQARRMARHHQADVAALARLVDLADRAVALAAAEALPDRQALRRLRQEGHAWKFEVLDGSAERARLDAAISQADARLHEAESAHRQALLDDWNAVLVELRAAVADPASNDVADRVKAAQKRARQLPTLDDAQFRTLEHEARELSDAFFEARRVEFETRSVERWANATAKEALILAAEALDAVEDVHQVARDVRELQSQWKTIGPVPREQMDTLWDRFKAACDRNYARARTVFDAETATRVANLAARMTLIEQVEALVNSTDWTAAAEAIKAAQAEWKTHSPVPREDEQPTWERFHNASNAFFERRRAHYEELDAARAVSAVEKERLAVEAEALAASTDWHDAESFRRMQADWKKLGPAPREQEDALWERFRGACDAFFARFDALRPANLAAKQALLTNLEALLANAGADAAHDRETAQAIMGLQKEWKLVGPATKDEEQPLWDRFSNLCDTFFGARKEHLDVVRGEREANLAAKTALAEEAEALAKASANSTDFRATADAFKGLQQQWKATGPAPRREEDVIWARFQTACNSFFEARRKTFDAQEDKLLVNLAAKQELCRQLEIAVGLVADDTPAKPAPKPVANKSGKAVAEAKHTRVPRNLAEELTLALQANFVTKDTQPPAESKGEEVRRIQARWQEIGNVPRDADRPLWARYRAALDHFYGSQPPRQSHPDLRWTAKPAPAVPAAVATEPEAESVPTSEAAAPDAAPSGSSDDKA